MHGDGLGALKWPTKTWFLSMNPILYYFSAVIALCPDAFQIVLPVHERVMFQGRWVS